MTTAIRLTYYGMDGEGATVKEAKMDASRKVERALEGSYSPEIVWFGKSAVLIWREPSGWSYRFLLEHKSDLLFSSSTYDSREEARRPAILHLVLCTYNAHDDDAVEKAVAFVGRDTASIQRIREDVRFQRAYKLWADQGLPDSICHARACGDMSR